MNDSKATYGGQMPFTTLPNDIVRGGHGALRLSVLLVIVSHGKCWASAETIAKEVGCSRSSVFDAIIYWIHEGTKYGIDLTQTKRKGETTIYEISYSPKCAHTRPTGGRGVSNRRTGTRPTGGHKEEHIEEEPIKNSEGSELSLATPKNEAVAFFGNPTSQETAMGYFVAKGIPEAVMRREMAKFVAYWTEPNPTGTKQRWQMEKTFEIRRRLVTWVQRVQTFHVKHSNQEPKGITI